jgi:hypothetical protein
MHAKMLNLKVGCHWPTLPRPLPARPIPPSRTPMFQGVRPMSADTRAATVVAAAVAAATADAAAAAPVGVCRNIAFECTERATLQAVQPSQMHALFAPFLLSSLRKAEVASVELKLGPAERTDSGSCIVQNSRRARHAENSTSGCPTSRIPLPTARVHSGVLGVDLQSSTSTVGLGDIPFLTQLPPPPRPVKLTQAPPRQEYAVSPPKALFVSIPRKWVHPSAHNKAPDTENSPPSTVAAASSDLMIGLLSPTAKVSDDVHAVGPRRSAATSRYLAALANKCRAAKKSGLNPPPEDSDASSMSELDGCLPVLKLRAVVENRLRQAEGSSVEGTGYARPSSALCLLRSLLCTSPAICVQGGATEQVLLAPAGGA